MDKKDPKKLKDFRCASERERVSLDTTSDRYARHPPLERHQVYIGKPYEYAGHVVTLEAVVYNTYIGKPFGWVDDPVAHAMKVVQLSELVVPIPACAKKVVEICTASLLVQDLGRNAVLHMVKEGGLRLFLSYHYELPDVELQVAIDHVYSTLRERGILSPTASEEVTDGDTGRNKRIRQQYTASMDVPVEEKPATIPDTRPGLIDGS